MRSPLGDNLARRLCDARGTTRRGLLRTSRRGSFENSTCGAVTCAEIPVKEAVGGEGSGALDSQGSICELCLAGERPGAFRASQSDELAFRIEFYSVLLASFARDIW